MTSPVPSLESRFLEPAGFAWGTFVNARGLRLRWGHLSIPRPNRTCVLVGGFGEFIEKYFETAQDFARRGFSVWCLDWAGQGEFARPDQDPTRPRTRDFDSDADDLAQFAGTVVKRDGPLLLAAHSMGGAIGLMSLARYPGVFDAAALSAPMLRIKLAPLPRWLAHMIVSTAVALGKADAFGPGAGRWKADPKLNGTTSYLSHDDVRCVVQRDWYLARPALQVDGVTYGWLASSLDATERLASPALLAGVKAPVLIGSAGNDKLLDIRQHAAAVALLAQGKLVSLPGARHELFMESDEFRKPWFAAIDGFVKDHLPA